MRGGMVHDKRFRTDIMAKLIVGRELRRREKRPGGISDAVFQGWRDFYSGAISEEEFEKLEEIERIFRELKDSNQSLKFTDYGLKSGEYIKIEKSMRDLVNKSSLSTTWAYLIFRLVRSLKPERCLELGTGLGKSSAYMGSALALNGNGHLVTLEGGEALAAIAEENFVRLKLTNIRIKVGRFSEKLPEVLENETGIDFAFIDGHHQEEATIAYFNLISSKMVSNSVMLFDDINWSWGMRRAWKRVSRDKKVKVSVNLLKMGLLQIK
jgi:predicted O-methyltransferase YrrM